MWGKTTPGMWDKMVPMDLGQDDPKAYQSSANANLLNTLLDTETGEEDIVEQVDKLVKSCLGYTINYGEENNTSCKYPGRDLFLWALLFNRRELADMFWERTENNTAMALVATIFLHSLAKTAEEINENVLHDSLKSYSCEFEKRAIAVLNQRYKDNKLDTEELVKMKVDECGDKTILFIANVEYMEFMGETCCDSVIHNQWTGGTLGKTKQVHTTRLKCKLLEAIPDLSTHSERRGILLIFDEDVGGALKQACTQDSDAAHLAKAAQVVRRNMFRQQYSFNGSIGKGA
ncbi:hypothetical protein LSAT2_010917 [Lamellibrachia satsuma]|nr:hypothetical protein LSAT2_010917 [Lamellibrachia satsuma]